MKSKIIKLFEKRKSTGGSIRFPAGAVSSRVDPPVLGDVVYGQGAVQAHMVVSCFCLWLCIVYFDNSYLMCPMVLAVAASKMVLLLLLRPD